MDTEPTPPGVDPVTLTTMQAPVPEMRDAHEFFAMYKKLGGSAGEVEYLQRLKSFFLYTLNAQLGYIPEYDKLPPTATENEKGYRYYASAGEAQKAFTEAEKIGRDEFELMFCSVDFVHPYS